MTTKRYMRRRGGTILCSPAEFIRWQLPYGIYHCANGREVLFDRDYAPICERSPDEAARRTDPHEWIKDIVREEWFYDDGSRKKRDIAEAKLIEWGQDMYKSVMDEIEQRVRAGEVFSARKGWVQPHDAANHTREAG